MVIQGLEDLARGAASEAALLLLVAEPRLASLGILLETGRITVPWPREHALYSALEEKYGRDAHSRYNSLIRRIVSFTHALEREESARIQAQAASEPRPSRESRKRGS